jgi:hypothetical protein
MKSNKIKDAEENVQGTIIKQGRLEFFLSKKGSFPKGFFCQKLLSFVQKF